MSIVNSVPGEYARRQAARCIPAVESALPIEPLPDEGVDRGRYNINHFSPTQQPLDYIDLLPQDDDADDLWRSGIRNLADDEDWGDDDQDNQDDV